MKHYLLFLVFFTAFLSQAEIVEIKSYSEALHSLEKADLVVFDIDNTLLRPAQTLGSDQWYGWRVDTYKKSGLSEERAIQSAIKDWIQVQEQSSVQLSEKNIPQLIQTLINRDIQVLALTARPIELIETTLNQLDRVGISFTKTLRGKPAPAIFLQNDIAIKSGIIFVGPFNNKGTVLKDYLEKNSLKPKNLVFFDDKKKHVESLEKVFSKTDVKYLGYRYAHLDPWVQAFDPVVAAKAWEHFKNTGAILPDEQFTETFLLDCKGNGDIRSLFIEKVKTKTFKISYVYDLDVPGGAHGNVELWGTGQADMLALQIKVYSKNVDDPSAKFLGTITGKPDQGDNRWTLTGSWLGKDQLNCKRN